MSNEIKFKNAVFCSTFENKYEVGNDITCVKEKHTMADGTTRTHFYFLENVQRPFYIEKKKNQKYKDKKETRPREELDEFWCTQSELKYRIAKALGVRGDFIPGVKKLALSPYLYGADMSAEVFIKRQLDNQYQQTYGDYTPPLQMAVLDYETDMGLPGDVAIMGSVTMKDSWTCAIDKTWLAKVAPGKTKAELFEVLETYLGDIAKERGTTVRESVFIVDSEIDIVRTLFAKLHELQPDVCSIWNMVFDIDVTIKACERAGVDINDIFCDPSIPEQFRNAWFYKDEGNKQKADGKSSSKDVSDKWHWMYAPASFQFIDNMCLYRTTRAVEQKLAGGYGLDNVLEHVFKGKLKKMKFAKASHLMSNTPEWHKFMQKNYPFEYVAYNIFDCVVMEMLDEHEKDVTLKLYTYAGITHWSKIKSNPRRLADAYHFFLTENYDRVLCTTSSKMKHEFDDYTLPKTGWTITLDNTLPSPKYLGYNPYSKDEDGNNLYPIRTKITTHAYDSDVKGAYPSNELAYNVGRDTTLVEVCSMGDMKLSEHRSICVNLTNVKGNATRMSRQIYNLPTHDELLHGFLEELGELPEASNDSDVSETVYDFKWFTQAS